MLDCPLLPEAYVTRQKQRLREEADLREQEQAEKQRLLQEQKERVAQEYKLQINNIGQHQQFNPFSSSNSQIMASSSREPTTENEGKMSSQ